MQAPFLHTCVRDAQGIRCSTLTTRCTCGSFQVGRRSLDEGGRASRGTSSGGQLQLQASGLGQQLLQQALPPPPGNVGVIVEGEEEGEGEEQRGPSLSPGPIGMDVEGEGEGQLQVSPARVAN